MCKRIWDQELKQAPSSNTQATATSGKAGGRARSQTLAQIKQQCRWSIPSVTHPLRFQVLRSSHLGLSSRPRQCLVFSFSTPSWRSLMLLLPRTSGETRDRQRQSVQPKGSDQLCPHSCSEGLHQTECGEASKGCIVEEHDVEIA